MRVQKEKGPHLIAKTAAHRAQRIGIIGFPASAWTEKPLRAKK